jgi:hypothetical protein
MSNERITRLAADLAHDLNNLFGGIHSLASLQPLGLTEEQREDLESITRAASDGLAIAERLQQIAQVAVLQMTEISLSSWLSSLVAELSCDLAGDTQLLLTADAMLLRQALRAMWQHVSGLSKPLLRLVFEEGCVTFVFQGQLPEQTLIDKKILRARRLGWFLVELAAEAHEGEASLVEKDTLVVASLRLPRVIRQNMLCNLSQPRRLSGQVLVVHEKSQLRRAIAGVLQPYGASVLGVSTLEEALSILLSQDVSVVLLGQHFWSVQEVLVGRFVTQCHVPICVLGQEGLAASSFPCLSANFTAKELLEAIGLSETD